VLLKDIGVPERPWEEINYDFIMKLPISNGYDSILVVVDRFSRQAHFIPCNESLNAEGLAELFIREIWRLHGLPKRTISDQGATFNSHFLRALYKRLGIQGDFSTAYHPETNGLAERTNQWLEGYLRSFCNYDQDDWSTWLPIAEFCHNNHTNRVTGRMAFETVYGLHPRWEGTDGESDVLAAEEFMQKMEKVWDEVRASMELHRQIPPEETKEFCVGDRVYLATANIKTRRPTKKLDDKRIGPFTITEKVSSHAYRLKLPKSLRIHDVFHANLLTAEKRDTEFHWRQITPPPVVSENGEEEYEIERILSWRRTRAGLWYLVRWKGYGLEEDTFE
jgi:transposase InsO family protein